MTKRRKDEISIKFVSNSAIDVTGSAVMVSYKNNDYLLDFGAVQGFDKSIEKEYITNYQYSHNLNINNLKCILLSHQNYDHCGLIPALCKRGYASEIAGTYEALEFAKKILFDSSYIINKNYEALKSKRNKIEPLYKESDVTQATYQMRSYELNRVYKFDDYMSFMLVPTNHLTGSCQIVMWIRKESGKVVKIHFTGDLGNDINYDFNRFLWKEEIVPSSNIVISECTYFGNDNTHSKKDCIEERKLMKSEILKTLKNNGKIVIPCFSMQRSQQMLHELYKMFGEDEDFNYSVIIDGKLTNDINNTFKKVLQGEDLEYFNNMLSWKNVRTIREYKETIACMSTRQPMIVLCSSGMGISGHSVEWIKSCIDCSRDKIFICGYVPEGSNLDKLYKKEQKTITWDKRTYQIRCEVLKFNTFSSHKSANGIINMMKQINTGMIIYHHGSKTAKENAVKRTVEELRKIGKTTKVLSSYKGMEIKL